MEVVGNNCRRTETGREIDVLFYSCSETTSVYGFHFKTARLENAFIESNIKMVCYLTERAACYTVPSHNPMLDRRCIRTLVLAMRLMRDVAPFDVGRGEGIQTNVRRHDTSMWLWKWPHNYPSLLPHVLRPLLPFWCQPQTTRYVSTSLPFQVRRLSQMRKSAAQ